MSILADNLTNPGVIGTSLDVGRSTLRGVNKWPTYDGGELDRSKFLTASEAGSCPRQVYFSKTGQAVDDGYVANQGYFDRGHDVEAWVVENLAAGLHPDATIEYALSEQQSFYDVDLHLSATPDGLITPYDTTLPRIYLEVKSVDPRTNLEAMEEPKAKHKTQMRLGAFLVEKCLEEELASSGIIIYQDCSNLDRRRIFNVDLDLRGLGEPGPTVGAAILRASALLGAPDACAMQPVGMATGECALCAYRDACAEAGSGIAPRNKKGLPAFAPRGAVGLLRRTYQAYVVKKRVEGEYNALKEEVEKKLIEEGQTEIVAGPYTASVKEVKGRESLDKEKMVKAGIDIDKFTKRGSPYLRFDIDKNGEDTGKDN